MRRMISLVCVTMLLLGALSAISVPVVSDNEDPDAEGKILGDWNISLTKTLKDQTIEVSGNVTVKNGGTLILDNVTLIMNSTPSEDRYIIVNFGGDLRIINGSVVTNNATFDKPYYIDVEYGGSVTISGSEINNLGNESLDQNFDIGNLNRMGMFISSSTVTIKDSTIKNSFVGTICSALLPISPKMENVTYENNSVGLGYTLACNPVMTGNTYVDNDIGLMAILKANAAVSGDTFKNNRVAVLASLSTLSLKDLLVENSTDIGIMGLAGSVISAENINLKKCNNATFLDNSTLYLSQSLVTNSTQWDFFLDNESTMEVLNGIIDDRNGIKVNDTASHFKLIWDLDVKVEYPNGDPVVGALVNVTNVKDALVVNSATDATGKIPTENVVELEDRGQGIVNLTPHNVTGEKGAFWNLTQIGLTGPMSLVLTLFERDLVSPDISISTPDDGVHVNDTVVMVSGAAYDDKGLALVEVGIGTGNWTAATGTDSWSFEIHLITDGTYDICARATDTSGNRMTTCVNVTLDRVGPTLEVIEPLNGQYFNISQLFVKGTTDADVVTINDEDVTIFENNFSYPITLLMEGENDIVIEARDLASNVNRTVLRIYRDLVPPSISVLSPVPYSQINSTTVMVAGNVTDGLGVKDMLASTDNITWRPVDVNYTNSNNSTGAFTVTLILPEGVNRIYLKAMDRALNMGTFEFNITVILPDLVPPVVTIVTPLDGDRFETLNVSMTGTATDDRGLVSVEYRVGNGSWRPVTNDDDWATWSVGLVLDEGLNTIKVMATDIGGNDVMVSVTVTATKIVIDTEDPVVNITSQPDQKVVHRKTITIFGVASDNVGVRSVFISTVGAGADAEWIIANFEPGDGTWSSKVTLKDGWNEVAVKAVDDSQNEGVSLITIKYAKEPSSTGLDMNLMLPLILVIVVLVVVYVLTLPGRKKAKMADMDTLPDEDEEMKGEEE